MLPDMTVALYLHDASHTQIDYEAMQGYRQAAREGRWVNEDELPIAGETKCVLLSSLSAAFEVLTRLVDSGGPTANVPARPTRTTAVTSKDSTMYVPFVLSPLPSP